MPELPEVQTVLNTLERQIKGRRIMDIQILYPPIVICCEKEFRKRLIGSSFCGFKRRGKYLLLEMEDVTLVSHLRMEGKYFILEHGSPVDKHDHVIFYLDDGRELRYNDVRKFGRMELIEKQEDYRCFKGLGPEPFSDEFNAKYCYDHLKEKKQPIKQVLLDQSLVAGIGNIYAEEVLSLTHVDPRTPACRLSTKQLQELVEKTRYILNRAIEAGGTTIRSYTSSLGVTGMFQLDLNVHGLKICPVCSSEIRKIRVGGRGTYYCPRCQKRKR